MRIFVILCTKAYLAHQNPIRYILLQTKKNIFWIISLSSPVNLLFVYPLSHHFAWHKWHTVLKYMYSDTITSCCIYLKIWKRPFRQHLAKSVFEHAQNALVQIILRIHKHPLGLCSLVIHFVVSYDCLSRQWRSWSDCWDAQSDLGFTVHAWPKSTFLLGGLIWQPVWQILQILREQIVCLGLSVWIFKVNTLMHFVLPFIKYFILMVYFSSQQ